MVRAKDPPKQPQHSARTGADKAARAARVAQEMRRNLLKRKAQQRAKKASPSDPDAPRDLSRGCRVPTTTGSASPHNPTATEPTASMGREMKDCLRLKAVDADDLSVIAACLQDALIPLSEMVYLPDERRFLAAFTRFRRECLADPNCCDGLTQCQSVLAFNGVECVKHHGLDPRFGGVKLEFLTMVPQAGDDGLVTVVLLFAGDMALQLRVRDISATLCDFGEPWPASAAPRHELATESA